MNGNVMTELVSSHLFLECGWVVQHIVDETVDDTLSRIYGTFVDNYIQKCESKAELRDSGDYKNRRNAMRAEIKTGFLRTNRSLLIKYLIEKNAPLKAHRIEHHLNRKYAESVSPKDVYAVLFKECMNR